MIFVFEDFLLDPDRRELRRGGDLVAVEPQNFDLLHYLICNRERVVSRDNLIAAVWGGRIVSESTLSSRINAVRTAVGDNGRSQRLIKTFARKGVRFIGPVGEDAAETRVGQPLPNCQIWEKPTIAVLPFTNFGRSIDPNRLCDYITQEIIIELSRSSELLVTARNLSSRHRGPFIDSREIRELGVTYVLQGSVRRERGRVRITAQLIDAATGAHCWAERYDRGLRNVSGVQADVARTIANVLVTHVNREEAARCLLKPTARWGAHDYYLRAIETLNSFWSSARVADLQETRSLLKRSICIDARYARSHALLADTYVTAYQTPVDANYINAAALDEANRHARKALECDYHLPFAHAVAGYVLGFRREHDASLVELDQATALNPNYTDWRLPMTFVMAGQHRRAVQAARTHILTDPFYSPRVALWMGVAYFMLRRYDDAVPYLKEAVARAPNSRGCRLWSAANYGQMGYIAKAREEMGIALCIDPKFTLDLQARLASVCRKQEDIDHHLEGLRKAGLPER